MIGMPAVVAADDVHIYASARTARIVFTQRWSSGTYADRGPKQLVLRHDPAGYHIAREELFASDKGKPGHLSTTDVDAVRRFAFVVDGEVVLTTQGDDAWGRGPPTLEKQGADRSLVRSRRAIDVAKLPADFASMKGMAVRLMDASGVRCEAKLGELLLRGRIFEGPVEEDDTVSGGADAAEVWATSPHYLVARVVGAPRACAGATWARGATLATPAMAAAVPAAGDLARRALAAFGALPESAKLQHDFARWYAAEHPQSGRAPPLWFRLPRRPPVIRVLRQMGHPALISVSARVDEGDCAAGVSGGIWALWELDDRDPTRPRLVLRNQPDAELTLQPTAAVDVDGDGVPELLFDSSSDYASVNAAGQPDFLEHGIVRVVDGAYVLIQGPETPIYVCPC